MQVKFRRMPGMIFDWISILSLKCNSREKWMSSVVIDGSETEDMTYIDYWKDQFPDPEEMLQLFFYLPDQSKASYAIKLFEDSMLERRGDITLESFLEKIQNTEELVKDLSQFYLHHTVTGLSALKVGESIRQSELPKEIQFLLLEFLITPESFIDSICDCFNSYHEIMSQIHQQQGKEVLGWQEKVGEPELMECYYAFHDPGKRATKSSLIQIKEINYSVSLIMKYTLLFKTAENSWAILGKNYEQRLRAKKMKQTSIEKLGNAVGDKSRVAIMEFIMKEGEKNSNEVAKKLGIALNTAVYHLEVMRKAKLLCSHSVGKGVYFWINPESCLNAAEAFQRWAKGV